MYYFILFNSVGGGGSKTKQRMLMLVRFLTVAPPHHFFYMSFLPSADDLSLDGFSFPLPDLCFLLTNSSSVEASFDFSASARALLSDGSRSLSLPESSLERFLGTVCCNWLKFLVICSLTDSTTP